MTPLYLSQPRRDQRRAVQQVPFAHLCEQHFDARVLEMRFLSRVVRLLPREISALLQEPIDQQRT